MAKPKSEVPEIAEYYPLAAGRVCAYRFESPEWPGKTRARIAIESVSQASGKLTAAVIETKSPSNAQQSQKWKVESDSEGIREIRAGAVKWLIKPPLAEGTSWRGDDGTEYVIESLDAKVEVPAGMFERCLHLSYWNEDLGNGDLFFAKGVGLVRNLQRGEWIPYDYWLESVSGGTKVSSFRR